MTNYIIIAALAILAVIFAVLYFCLKSRIVTLEDEAPAYGKRRSEKLDAQANLLALQEQLWPHIKRENGKVSIKICK